MDLKVKDLAEHAEDGDKCAPQPKGPFPEGGMGSTTGPEGSVRVQAIETTATVRLVDLSLRTQGAFTFPRLYLIWVVSLSVMDRAGRGSMASRRVLSGLFPEDTRQGTFGELIAPLQPLYLIWVLQHFHRVASTAPDLTLS